MAWAGVCCSLKGDDHPPAVAGQRHGRVRTGNSVASKAGHWTRESVAGDSQSSNSSASQTTAATGSGNGQNVSDNSDNYNRIHIEEVIDSKNSDQREFSAITGRSEQPVNRQ